MLAKNSDIKLMLIFEKTEIENFNGKYQYSHHQSYKA